MAYKLDRNASPGDPYRPNVFGDAESPSGGVDQIIPTAQIIPALAGAGAGFLLAGSLGAIVGGMAGFLLLKRGAGAAGAAGATGATPPGAIPSAAASPTPSATPKPPSATQVAVGLGVTALAIGGKVGAGALASALGGGGAAATTAAAAVPTATAAASGTAAAGGGGAATAAGVTVGAVAIPLVFIGAGVGLYYWGKSKFSRPPTLSDWQNTVANFFDRNPSAPYMPIGPVSGMAWTIGDNLAMWQTQSDGVPQYRGATNAPDRPAMTIIQDFVSAGFNASDVQVWMADGAPIVPISGYPSRRVYQQPELSMSA